MVKDDLNILEYKYLELLDNNLSIKEFEQWVYQSDDLKILLSSDDYINLISLDYNSKYISYEIDKISDKYIDSGKLETMKIKALLTRALQKDEKIDDILRKLYYMYCDGYYFLQDLGLGYGLSCEVPSFANSWEELSVQQRTSIIDSFYPKLEYDLRRALDWIESKKVILIGKQNDINLWLYIDNRNNEEKKSTVMVDVKVEQGF